MITLIPKRGSVELRNAILDCIEAGMHRTAEIAAHLNLKSDQVSTRLDYLRQLGVIHASRIDEVKRGGFVNNWQLGPGPENQASYNAKDLPRRRATDERRVILSSAYPTIDRRDPLVTALFGAPVAERRAQQQSAPCCTRCHMEQGAGHQAGCIVAMVAA
jgi:hypothetical protein